MGDNPANKNEHLSLLRDSIEALQRFELGFDNSMKAGLVNLLEDLDCDLIHIYLYQKTSNSLECSQSIGRTKAIIIGEGRVLITDEADDGVSQVFLGRKSHTAWDDGMSICVPIKRLQDILGVIVVNGRNANNPIDEDLAKVADFGKTFGLGIYNFISYLNSEKQRSRFLTFSKIWMAMGSTMNYKDILSIILRSVIAELKFDRVKLYLVNKPDSLLEGSLVADVRGVFQAIEQEKYPLKKGPPDPEDEMSKLIINVPLEVRGEKIGLMAIENIFSQKPITDEDVENIKIFANQAALTIENAQLFKKVEELSITDGLTGLYIFRYFKQRLAEEIARADRFKEDLTLMIADVDDFKRYNDTYGHPVGDAVLQELSKMLIGNVREVDLVGRYGGDEFVVIFPRLKQAEAKEMMGTRVHQAISGHRFQVKDKTLSFTISIGMATFPNDATSVEELVDKADKALYWAKQHGKNRVCQISDIGT